MSLNEISGGTLTLCKDSFFLNLSSVRTRKDEITNKTLLEASDGSVDAYIYPSVICVHEWNIV